MSTKTRTAGQELTATLRRYFHIGPRTRKGRNGDNLHADMLQNIAYAATEPGYFTPTTEAALRAGWVAYLSYQKHIAGYRVDGNLIFHITSLSPWHFAAFLGAIVDAGISNVGEAERYFNQMARDIRSA